MPGAGLERRGRRRVRQTRPRAPPRTEPIAATAALNRHLMHRFQGQIPHAGRQLVPRAQRCLVRTPATCSVPSRCAGRLSRLSVGCLELGLRLERSEPGKPQQDGRLERRHLTGSSRPAAASGSRASSFPALLCHCRSRRPSRELTRLVRREPQLAPQSASASASTSRPSISVNSSFTGSGALSTCLRNHSTASIVSAVTVSPRGNHPGRGFPKRAGVSSRMTRWPLFSTSRPGFVHHSGGHYCGP